MQFTQSAHAVEFSIVCTTIIKGLCKHIMHARLCHMFTQNQIREVKVTTVCAVVCTCMIAVHRLSNNFFLPENKHSV